MTAVPQAQCHQVTLICLKSKQLDVITANSTDLDFYSDIPTQQTRHIYPMFDQCWADVGLLNMIAYDPLWYWYLVNGIYGRNFTAYQVM